MPLTRSSCTFAAEHHAGGSAASAAFQTPLLSKPMSLSTSDDFVGNANVLGGIFHEQRAVEPEADLRRRHHVRVIPVEPGVASTKS